MGLGGGLATAAKPHVIADLAAAHREFTAHDVPVLREPRREPWGLLEMWVSDPDGVRICVVEVPADHPLRLRL